MNQSETLLVELLSQLLCATVTTGARRWRGLRPAERAARLAEERGFQDRVDRALVTQLLGTTEYKLVS